MARRGRAGGGEFDGCAIAHQPPHTIQRGHGACAATCSTDLPDECSSSSKDDSVARGAFPAAAWEHAQEGRVKRRGAERGAGRGGAP